MTDLNKPVARDDETLVHLHFIKPSDAPGQVAVPLSQSTWIGTSVDRQLRRSLVPGRAVLVVTIDVGSAPSPYVPAEYEPDPIDVTDIRKALIAESYERFNAAKTISADAVATKNMTDDKAELIEAQSAAADYTYLLAGLLRIIGDEHGPDAARKMAELFDMVREHGTEALADVNSDLDEQAHEPPAHLTTPGCHVCGIPFELEGPKAQEPGTTYCRVCADAGPTPADIEAALDAKAEDDRIEAERVR